MRKKIAATITAITAFIGSAAAQESTPTSSGLGVQLAELTSMLSKAFGNWLGGLGDGTQAVIGFLIILLTGILSGVLMDTTVAAITIVLALVIVSYIGLLPTWIAAAVAIISLLILGKYGIDVFREG